jgi:hypothetical protein
MAYVPSGVVSHKLRCWLGYIHRILAFSQRPLVVLSKLRFGSEAVFSRNSHIPNHVYLISQRGLNESVILEKMNSPPPLTCFW